MLVSSDTNIYAEALNGLQSVSNAELQIIYLDNLVEEYRDLEDYFETIENGSYPVYMTVGLNATRVALDHLEATPVLFSMLDSPKSLGDRIGESCGVAIDVSIAEFFQTLKEIQPDARRVYAFYSTPEGELRAAEGDYVDLRQGLYYSRIRVSGRSDLEDELESIRDDADAIYLVADALYDRETFELLSRFSQENGIVLMTGFSSLVKAGATFAITPDYSNVGVITGQMANRIIAGESDCITEAVRYPEYTSFYLNEDYAGSSGVSIPDSISERARSSRLVRAGIDLYHKQKFRTALNIFTAVLDRDPGNRNAANYRSLVLERITGDRSRALVSEADAQMQRANYRQALDGYRRVLEINPGHAEARRGMEAARLALSNQLRQNAAALAARGQPFDAIRQYEQALQTLPTNEGARQELHTLRARMLPQVGQLIEEGRSHYDARRYDAAIQDFENVLLLQPGNGTAAEYLRLSRRKQEALERLLRRQ